jgi:single-strand DNA-binding protein
MNNLKNSVRLIGNLGGNPEVKELPSGKKLAKLSLATTEKYKDSDGKTVSETQWHYLVAWGKNADFAEKYLEKGNEIAIEGRLLNRSYTDKDGQKKYISEISVLEILKVGNYKKSDISA